MSKFLSLGRFKTASEMIGSFKDPILATVAHGLGQIFKDNGNYWYWQVNEQEFDEEDRKEIPLEIKRLKGGGA